MAIIAITTRSSISVKYENLKNLTVFNNFSNLHYIIMPFLFKGIEFCANTMYFYAKISKCSGKRS